MPEGFAIGPLYIHFYGILIMIGALAAAWVADREAKRRNINTDHIWDMLPWLLVGGVIGARLWHVLTPPASMQSQGIFASYYFTHPLDALAIWKGGLGIPGAVIGGSLAMLIYTRSKKLSFAVFADCVAPGLALAQAIGRWGNFINQELYGLPSDLPWAITISPNRRLPGYESVARYHPLFLYESIFNLLNFAFLIWAGRRWKDKLKPGDLFLTYMITYPIARMLLEFLRLDPSPVMGINFNQVLMGVIAIAAVVILYLRHRNTGETEVVEAGDAEEEEVKEEVKEEAKEEIKKED